MSLYHGCKTLTCRFRLVLSSFLQSDGLPFGDVLPEEEIERAFEEEGASLHSGDEGEETVYTPAVTLWAFLSQILHRGEQRSCTAAVSRVVVLFSLATGMLSDMDVLRCKTPKMVRREVWTHLLAYNLIRRSILQSATASGLSPRELSFTAAMQAIAASWAIAAVLDSRTLGRLVNAHLTNLTGHRVGHRPDRVEPRGVKRRPKPHRLLTKPRAELLAGDST